MISQLPTHGIGGRHSDTTRAEFDELFWNEKTVHGSRSACGAADDSRIAVAITVSPSSSPESGSVFYAWWSTKPEAAGQIAD